MALAGRLSCQNYKFVDAKGIVAENDAAKISQTVKGYPLTVFSKAAAKSSDTLFGCGRFNA